jgi:hypothetical protein
MLFRAFRPPNPERHQKSHNLRPKHTRISYYAALISNASAAFRKESRMKFANATNLDRKSGWSVAEDLLLSHPLR